MLLRKEDRMSNQFMSVDEVANMLQVSKSLAYKLVQKLNDELKEKGYLTVSGRVSRKYLKERFYSIEKEDQ